MSRGRFVRVARVAAFFATMVPVAVLADTLPLEDGAYLRNPEWCEKYFKNDLDFVDFEVEQEGRSFAFIEQGCLVHSVNKIRDNRFVVEADCIEGGEAFNQTLFIDIYADNSVRLDGGELHHYCTPQQQVNRQQTRQQLRQHVNEVLNFNTKSETPQEKLTRRFKAGLAISKWEDADERCRGGYDTTANTEKACDERQFYYQKIREQDWCLGKQGQSKSQYQWHDCEADSLQ